VLRAPVNQRRRPWQRSAALILIAAGSVSTLAAADWDVELARHLFEQGRILPLEQLLERAQRLRPGVPVEVELETDRGSGAYVYEIEMLDREGALWSVAFDAETGQLIHLDADQD